MDPETHKAKISELRKLSVEIITAAKLKDADTVKAKYEERKQKVRELKASR
jgi:hypothetical protein